MQRATEEREARAAIEDLHARYCHCIDDDRLEAWPDFFEEDGGYEVTTRANQAQGLPIGVIYCDSRAMMIDRVAAMRKAIVFEPHHYRHLTAALLVTARGDGVFEAVSNFIIQRTYEDGRTSHYCSGVYQDEIVLRPEGPRFRKRIVVLDSQRIDTLMVIPV